MSILQSLRDGIRRVNRAPWLLAGLLMATLLAAVPASLALRSQLQAHLGSSLAADGAAAGVNYEWWNEFSAQADGLARTFTPSVIGFAAILDNLSGVLDAQGYPFALVVLGGAYLLVWLFLSGGVLDRLARDRATRSTGFFWACGVYFVRFLRLVPLMGLAYYAVFAWVHPWLFDDLYGRVTRDLTVERTAFFWRAGLYGVFVLLLAFLTLTFDYARIRAVVEDRRSMVGAVAAALRFMRRNAAAVSGLLALNGLLLAIVLAAYAAVAPGAHASVWVTLLVGQICLIARLWVRLVVYASETSLFQGRLAHAGYTAARRPTWPDSPAAELIGSGSQSDAGSP
jgi:hypothetical protein